MEEFLKELQSKANKSQYLQVNNEDRMQKLQVMKSKVKSAHKVEETKEKVQNVEFKKISQSNKLISSEDSNNFKHQQIITENINSRVNKNIDVP